MGVSHAHGAQHHAGREKLCGLEVVALTPDAAQAVKSSPGYPASRARPLGGGCGSSPRWVRIL